MPSHLHATEISVLAIGVILLASVVLGRLSSRLGLPVLVVFLGLGMLAGSEGLGGIFFDDYHLAYLVGTIALVLILFDGGLRTRLEVVKAGIGPAVLLSTAGVAVTAAVIGFGARGLGFDWTDAFLLGAIVSSTDAAAVFSVLRGGGIRLPGKVAGLVELESGLNDPMAVLLTIGMVGAAAEQRPIAVLPLLARVAAQLAIGGVIGLALGWGARAMLGRIRRNVAGLFPVFTIALAFVTYGCASLASGSGFLAVFVAAVVLGNAPLDGREELLQVHDFIAWTGQIVMFVVLGLLVFPSRVLAVGPAGLALAAILMFIARPAAVAVCLLPFGFRGREITLVSWLGLRGAVPIILAMIPVLAGVQGAEEIFDVVFFVVLLSALLQGGTARPLARRLHAA